MVIQVLGRNQRYRFVILSRCGKCRKQAPKIAPQEPIHKPKVERGKKRKQYNKNYDNLIAHPDDKKIMKHNCNHDDIINYNKDHLMNRLLEKTVIPPIRSKSWD